MSSVQDGTSELLLARTRLFRIIERGLKQLHVSSPPPSSFYRWQEYVEDKLRIHCVIAATFQFSGALAQTKFYLHNSLVTIEQRGPLLIVRVRRRISQRLVDDMKFLGRGHYHVVAYLVSYLPKINRLLTDNRYYSGNLLSRNFSIFEALSIVVICKHQLIPVTWPPAFASFPPSVALAGNVDQLFVHDYIDSIQSYFCGEYDDCVRRVVTGAENFFRAQGWDTAEKETLIECLIRRLARKPKPNPRAFNQILRKRMNTKISGKVIQENMHYVYGVRNRIVHNGFRMSTKSERFCSKSITTLKYLLIRYSNNQIIGRYVHSLGMQFVMQSQFYADTWNLDIIERRREEIQNPKITMNDSDDIENYMFNALRFDGHDKRSIER
jgi:hypothetical protein